MKICKNCVKTLPTTAFYASGHKRKDGTQALMAICSACFQAKAQERLRDPEKRAKYIAYQRQYQKSWGRKHRTERFAWIDEVKSKPCMDCGGSFPPECMDFDHRDPKTKLFDVSRAAVSGSGLESVKEEIAKCDLVCANCHRIRTAKQQNRRRS